MKAMIIDRITSLADERAPLSPVELPVPRPGEGETLIRVAACGVCHTELDEIEGRTPPPRLPVIPGHQVVGRVVENGPGAKRFPVGARVGWPGSFRPAGPVATASAATKTSAPVSGPRGVTQTAGTPST
ncbi:MAG TPA: alcohol dehydrogenase catalytic domain-containing protein [Syntrophales bacterium]